MHGPSETPCLTDDPSEEEDLLTASSLSGPLSKGRSALKTLGVLVLGLMIVLALGLTVFKVRPLVVQGKQFQQLYSLRHRGQAEEEEKHVQTAECFFDASNAAVLLAKAGLEINGATIVCPHVSELQAKEKGENASDTTLEDEATRILPEHRLERLAQLQDDASSTPQEVHERAEAAHFHGQRFLKSLRALLEHTSNTSNASTEEEHEEEEVELEYKGKHLNTSSVVAERLCSATVAGTLGSFSLAASFISATVGLCPGAFNSQAYCSSDISRLVGTLSELAAGASVFAVTCPNISVAVNPVAVFGGRRLHTLKLPGLPGEAPSREEEEDGKELSHEEKEKKEKQTLQAECAIDITQMVFILGQTSLEINGAVYQCKEVHESFGEGRSEEGREKLMKTRCSSSIAGAFGGFLLVANLISNAALECSATMDFIPPGLDGAACASGILQFLAAIAESAAAIIALSKSCVPQNFKVIPKFEDGEDGVIAEGY